VKLKAVDYLEWLRGQEEDILWEMELAEKVADNMHIEELEETLQNVRGIKHIVREWADEPE
jgi:hypothetical protein